MNFPRLVFHRAPVFALLAGVLSCIDAPTAPRPLARVTATPEALSLRPLDTLSVAAEVTSLDGVPLSGRVLEWRSLDTTIASVTDAGLVTARAYTGPARRTTSILVTSANASTDTVPVEVLPWAVARVIATPAELTVSPRDSAQLALRLESAEGLELTGRAIAWIAEDTSVAQVSASGLARARVYTGPLTRQTRLLVFSEGIADTVQVSVLPLSVASVALTPSSVSLVPGQLDTLSALVRAASGETLSDTPLTWRSADTTIARVNGAGVVTAAFYVGFETRVTSVIVAHGGVADTTAVEVRPLAVSRVVIAPDSAEMLPGAEFLLSATLTDATGSFLTDRPVLWITSDTTVARVNAAGLVTALDYGSTDTRTARIAAWSAGNADTITVRVTPHAVFSIEVQPAALLLQPLDSVFLNARLESISGTELSNRIVAWSTLDSAVATVRPWGRVNVSAYTGAAVRRTAIFARSESAVDTIPLEVLPLGVQRVVIEPNDVTLPPLGTASLTVATLSANGTVLSGHSSVWLSSDTAIVRVSDAGVVTARPYVGPLQRSAQIVVFSNGLADTATVTVQPLAPTSVTLSTDTLSMVPGEVRALGALVRSAAADTLRDFPLLWTATDTTIARVNDEGVVTAAFYVGPNTRSATVAASLGALSDSVIVRVRPLQVASIEVVADPTPLSPNASVQFSAIVRDSGGLFLSGRAIAWRSSDSAIARVDSTGRVTAATYGGTTTRSVEIVASTGDVSDSATVTIAPLEARWLTAAPEALSLQPLDTATIAALVQSIDLTQLTDRTVSFASLDTLVARVDAAGRVTASAYTGPAVRSTAIVLNSGAATDTVPVSVTPLAIARVIASPSAVTITVGDSATLSAVTESSNGTTLSGREFVWLSSDTSVVQMTASGLVRTRPYAGPIARSALIVVYSGGLADTTTVSVAPLSASTLQVTPEIVSLIPGGVASLGAVVRTIGGDTLTDFPLEWTSTDTTIARVNVEGVVTAAFYVGALTRSARVIVATGALADTSVVEVSPLPVSSVTIVPDSGSLFPSGVFQLDAAARSSEGLLVTERTISWTALTPAIATVDGAGLVTALPYGGTATLTAQIVASSGGAADTISLNIEPHVPAWITATPEALGLLPLDSATISASVAAIDLTVLSDRPLTWTSLDTSVATVTADGRVTAASYSGPALRSTSIIVTSGAATDTVPVTITPFAVARVITSPSVLSLAPRDSSTLTATVQSASGLNLSDRAFAWLSGDTAVVSVSNAGVVTARPYVGPLTRTAQIVVYSEGLADTTSVSVQPLSASAVEVIPASASLLPGGVAALGAIVRTIDGDTLTNFPLTWSSTDTTVARVNVEGVVTAAFYVGAATRTANVIVATGALADTSSIEVLPLTVASVVIAPDTGSLLPSGTFQLDAALRDGAGLLLSDRTTSWTSLNSSVATVDAAGLVVAAAYGGSSTRTVEIVASNGGEADTITLDVLPHGVAWITATPEALSFLPLDTATIAATLAAANLTVLSDRPVSWISLDPTVATVTAEGLVTAVAYTGPTLRSTSIVITSASATDTVPVSVAPFSVARVVATPTSLSLAPNDSSALSASVESAGGVILSERSFLWLSSDASILTVDSVGVVRARPYTGRLERTADVVVYSEGQADTVAITVTPLPPASIAIAPDSISILPGEQSTLTTSVRDSSAIVLSDVPVTWSSSDPTIASVNADGVVTGLFYVGPNERTTTIIATTGLIADTALVRVRALLVDSITVFPDTQTLRPEQTLQLDAVLRDSAGLFLSGRTISWSSSDTSLASVSESGLVRALVGGNVTITASSGGVSAQALVTIVPVVTEVRVTPELSTLWIGRTQPFTVALRDTNGVAPTGRRVTWTSSDPTRATVDSVGVVTALSTGLVTIRATSEGRTDSTRIDVFPEPTSAVTISFDDSWRGVLELAYPVMQELRLRANVGWITDVDWAGVMTPTELRVLQDAGWSIVSHSMTHPFMTQISIDSARAELVGSRARIQSLGFDPRVFVAPYLDHNDAVLVESAAAGYTYSRCCAQDAWSTDTLVAWPILPEGRHRLAGVDVTNYDGQISSYNFRTVEGRDRLRQLLVDVVAQGKFLDVFFHDILPADVPDLRLTLEMLAEFRPYLITYAMLP